MSDSMALKIIKSVAEVENKDPLDLDYRIEDHIDTDAVEALVSHENASFTLTFELPNSEVTVTEDGTVFAGTEREQIK